MDDLIDSALETQDVGSRTPHYANTACCSSLDTLQRRFSGPQLVRDILRRIEQNWSDGGRQRRSEENWRFEERRGTKLTNPSQEKQIEKAVARASGSRWANQVPVASGLTGNRADSGRHLDLVHRTAPGHYEFVELKHASNTPLYAAMELLGYGALYLFARTCLADDPGKRARELLVAQSARLQVLAPSSFYNKYARTRFDWLEEKLTEGFMTVIQEHGLPLSMDFSFVSLPSEFSWKLRGDELLSALDHCQPAY